MANILYLHYGKGHPSFYVRVEKGQVPVGVKAIHGRLQMSRGFLAIVGASPRTSGYSTQKLKAAGYEEICSLGEDEGALSCFYKGTPPMPDAIRKAIIAWWSKKRRQEAAAAQDDDQGTADPEIPEPQFTSGNPWEW